MKKFLFGPMSLKFFVRDLIDEQQTIRIFSYIQIKSEESLQVFDWFDYLLEDSIYFFVFGIVSQVGR